MDPASALGALVATLTLMLQEVRRHRSGDDPTKIRGALLDLEYVVRQWHRVALVTNEVAKEYADGLPRSAGNAERRLTAAVRRQTEVFVSVRQMFGETWRQGPDSNGFTIEDLLRVYAPEVLDQAPLLINRQRQIRVGVADELERRFREDGRRAVYEYIRELDDATASIDRFREQLADFIASEFPLSDRS